MQNWNFCPEVSFKSVKDSVYQILLESVNSFRRYGCMRGNKGIILKMKPQQQQQQQEEETEKSDF